MKRRILNVLALAIGLASCSTAYKQGQTPDDVYYSPAKEKKEAYASADQNKYGSNYTHHNSGNYEDYTSSSEDNYLRMKTQDRYRWNSLDNDDYWYSPSYAYNNYYAYNSFNPFMFNSWGLSFYYSPFAAIQPYGWFSSYYPTYGYYAPYSGYYGHSYGYGYSPVFLSPTTKSNNVHHPLLGGYVNNNFNNANSRSRTLGRYVPGVNTGDTRYNNRNSFDNNNNINRSYNNSNYNNNSAPVRSFTPSGGSSSGGGGGVSRQPHH